MLKRCLSPLTLVNQVALMCCFLLLLDWQGWRFLAGWCRRSGQRPCDQQSGIAAHAKFRLLAAVPLSEKDKSLIKEMDKQHLAPN